MEDVKVPEVSEAPIEGQVEAETTAPASQPEKQTVTENVTEPAAPRMVPLDELVSERKKRQELQRKVAEIEGKQKLSAYDPTDVDAILQHPMVQELMIKQAKQELTDFARESLEKFPTLHPQVKKAILLNARGFINESTTDVETAKLDLQDYIERIAMEDQQAKVTPLQKTFPMANTNTPAAETAGNPADVAKILAKPVDEWSDAEAKLVEDYTKSQPKK